MRHHAILALCALTACATDRSAASKPAVLEGRAPAVHNPAVAAVGETGRGVELSLLFVEMPDSVATELLTIFESVGALQAVDFADRLRSMTQARQDVAIVLQPTLVLCDRALASQSVVDRSKHVERYEVDVNGASRPIATLAEEGFWLEVRPTRLDPDAGIRLEYSLTQRRILRPIRSARVTLSNGEEKEVELPEIAKLRSQGAPTVPPGHCWVFALSAGDPASPGTTLVVLTPSAVELPSKDGVRISTERAVHEAVATR